MPIISLPSIFALSTGSNGKKYCIVDSYISPLLPLTNLSAVSTLHATVEGSVLAGSPYSSNVPGTWYDAVCLRYPLNIVTTP